MNALRSAAFAPGTRRPHGQAMAEFIIACAFLLLPLFLIITLLVKYVDMGVATQEAARFAAFQRTVFMPTADSTLRGATAATESQQQIQNMMQQLFFGVDYSVSDQQTQNLNAYVPLPLWKDFADRNMVLAGAGNIAALSDSASGTLQDQGAQVVMGTLHSIGQALGADLGFDLDYNGLMAAQVSLTPANPSSPVGFSNLAKPSTLFEHLGLTFNAQDTVLADGWSAADPGNVKHQIDGMVPTALFSPVSTVLSIANFGGSSGIGLFPDLSGLKFGYVLVNDPNEVPADRLVGYQPGGGVNPPGGANPQTTTVTQVINLYQGLGYSCSQSTLAGGAIQVLCTNGSGSAVAVDVCSNGSQTAPVTSTTKTSSQNVQTTTQDQINSLTTQPSGSTAPAWSVTAGPSYTCQVKGGTTTGSCSLGDLSNSKSQWYQGTVIKSVTQLQQTVNYGNYSSTSYGTLTVTASGGGSTAVFATSSSSSQSPTCS